MMYLSKKAKGLPLFAAGLGIATVALRYGLYTTGVDEKNLLVPGNVLSVLVWASVLVTALAMVWGFIQGCRRMWEDYSEEPSIRGALGAVVLSAAIGYTVYVQGMPFQTVEKLSQIVGLLCVPCLLVSAFCRLKGVRPFFACHGCVCVYFCVHLVKCYGIWSANPQFQDYVFSMLACACLALFAYQQTAMDTDMGEGMLQYTLGLLAGYLGIAALYGAQHPWLYLAGSIWALTNLTRPAVAPWYRRAKEDI